MLKTKNISKKYKDFEIKDINLEVQKGEYFILLGNSGAGKTLLLEIIAGILKPTQGKVYLDNKDITHVKPQGRKIGLLFQDCALFPHLTVKQNLAFSLGKSKANRKIFDKIILNYAAAMNVSHLLGRYPETLSGGEKQRVALARTLVMQPKLLLLDEPLSSIDKKSRNDVMLLLKRLNRQGYTIIHVTHDYQEARALATNIAVMQKGRIIQSGQPNEIFHNPTNEFVAHFVGNKNFFPVNYSCLNGHTIAEFINTDKKVVINKSISQKEGNILVENDAISLFKNNNGSKNRNNVFEGRVIDTFQLLQAYELIIDIGIPVYVKTNGNMKNSYNPGDLVKLELNPEKIRIM